MTKNEHYKKAEEMLKRNSYNGRSYIRGSLLVQPKGELSDKLRALLWEHTKLENASGSADVENVKNSKTSSPKNKSKRGKSSHKRNK